MSRTVPSEDVVSFMNFKPLISEIETILREVVEITQAAEHNRRICETLKSRVYAAHLAVLDLDVQRDSECFNKKNYFFLQSLVIVMTKVKKFVSDISQMRALLKFNFIQPGSIEKTFKNLCKEFDECIVHIELTSFLAIKNRIHPDKEAKIKADQEELNKYMEKVVKGLEDFNEASMDNKSRIDNIFQVHRLNFADYAKVDREPRKNGRVTKWVDVRNKREEFAFKIISEEDKNSVQNQVTILRELHNCQNIIRFYGLTYDENEWYLATEWAEYGNLREFYTTCKGIFDLRLKLLISLDIVRGLNFLRIVEIVHRDIKAENILITRNHTAKLANFKLGRQLNAAILKQTQHWERVRHCAPELLVGAPNFKYDYRCEVYSFGILLWEIAEERTPDLVEMVNVVKNKHRESFSENSEMPIEFKNLAIKAVNHDPEFRPKITEMFEVLNKCFESFERSICKLLKSTSNYNSSPNQNLPDFDSFKYMTLAEAAKQHKMYDRNNRPTGDIKTAYKCFEAYVNNSTVNQITAKFFKAYYLSREFVDGPKDKYEIIAKLFKEVADYDEANEFPEVKLRYGDCLYNGKGVEKDSKEALKYFEQAAESGLKVAMYNTGKLYLEGSGITKNEEKGNFYMKLAVYNQYEPAIKYCKEHNLEKFAESKELSSNNATEWIRNALKDRAVNSISFSELRKPELLNEGGFGCIMKAVWTKINNYVVYKRLTNTTAIKYDVLDAFIRELQFHLRLDYSDRIIRCLGISQDDITKEYFLVMQYADGGDLRNYLKNNFKKLSWNDKKKLAFQIAEGLDYLHHENVLHRDLHSRNIVVHENNAKITDFGISKFQNDQNSTTYIGNFGSVAYMEPKRILDPKFPYTKSSDIYSLGVLMWEISSGYSPFKSSVSNSDKTALAIAINNGTRETEVSGTPKEYEKLYKNCWDNEPEQRPIISEILDEFAIMGFGINTKNQSIKEFTEENDDSDDLYIS